MATSRSVRLALCFALLAGAVLAHADTIRLRDGRTLENCYLRDEGVHLKVWEKMADVGTDRYRVIPRNRLAAPEPGKPPFEITRDTRVWDAKPDRADLTVTHIAITPRLPSLHGNVDYDPTGAPTIKTSPAPFRDPGDEKYMNPEAVVGDTKFTYDPGQRVTLTAHVRNVGFATAEPFRYQWLIEDEVVSEGSYNEPLAEMEIATFEYQWKWEDFKHATFKVLTDQPQVATINDTLKDPLWGFSFTYAVSNGRVAAWHEFRSAYGTFSFEDFYRWHLDIMNLLFEQSIFPAAPEGIKARVRLDRIIYADKVENNTPVVDGQAISLVREDGLRYDDGGWMWNDQPQELATGEWIQVNPEWRNATEWSLPHELGHQLGLVDWYALDFGGGDFHVTPDTGEKITHFMNYPETMMHWHGPQVFSEVDAGYLNDTWNKPRGYFGEMYFALPRQCYLYIVDVNGEPVPDAEVKIYQRGARVDPDGQPQTQRGVTFYPVIEDGDFYSERVAQASKEPVIVGRTSPLGALLLPNRPVREVKTLNGYTRRPNPFGNINVVGQRGLMLVEVTKEGEQPCHFFLEGHDFVAAWYRGQRDRYLVTLETPYGSVDSPPKPENVTYRWGDGNEVILTWERPSIESPKYQYLEEPIGYKVYRRISNMGLNDRPWFEVATVGPETTSLTIDLDVKPDDYYWFGQRNRLAVTTLAATSTESALAPVVVRSREEEAAEQPAVSRRD